MRHKSFPNVFIT